MTDLLPDSLPLWIAGALVLFWFVGAYNRLMRLRSSALQAYAVLDAALARQLEFVQASASEAQQPDATADDVRAGASLQASANQLATLLAATRLRPLDPSRIAAMATALHVMLGAWQRLHPDDVVSFDADGTLSRPAPLSPSDEVPAASAAAAPIAWPEPSAAAEIARGQFNAAIGSYNMAVTQFPAVLVAWIMQLRQAAPLL